jgi:hypothetical protein
MLTASDAKQFASRWIDAFNSRTIDRIMALYAEDAEVVSPTAIRVLANSDGTVRGWATVHDYFSKALAAYPFLSWQLIEVTYGLSCVVVYFVNEKATRSCEVLELDKTGKVIRHLATYSS